MRMSVVGRVAASCLVAVSLLGCGSVPDVPSRAFEAAVRIEEECRREYEAAVRDREEHMPRAVARGAEISESLYGGEPPSGYDDFLARVGHVRGDRDSLVRVGDAMDALFFETSSDAGEPDFRAAALSSVVHAALFATEGLHLEGGFDWSAPDASSEAQEVYDAVASMRSSSDELASKVALFRNLAEAAGLDDSAYADVVARDDAVVDACASEVARTCADHGIVVNVS